MNPENSKSKEPMQDTSATSLRPRARRPMDVHGAGGRIVRAPGRKDRHSKVCTARGPRDRRVRLSPNTAIQFYDVQDRLGYDRPSKAIDWLMKEAKAAIDALDNDDDDGAAARAMDHGHQAQSQEYLNGIPFGNCTSFSNGQFLAYPTATSNGQEQSFMMIPESFQRLLGSDHLPMHYHPSFPVSHYDGNQLHHLHREPLQSTNTFFPNSHLSDEIQDLEDQTKAFSSNPLLHYHQNQP